MKPLVAKPGINLLNVSEQEFATLQSRLERQQRRFVEKQIWLEAALLRALEQHSDTLTGNSSAEPKVIFKSPFDADVD